VGDRGVTTPPRRRREVGRERRSPLERVGRLGERATASSIDSDELEGGGDLLVRSRRPVGELPGALGCLARRRQRSGEGAVGGPAARRSDEVVGERAQQRMGEGDLVAGDGDDVGVLGVLEPSRRLTERLEGDSNDAHARFVGGSDHDTRPFRSFG
jgi:hypothetical protein